MGTTEERSSRIASGGTRTFALSGTALTAAGRLRGALHTLGRLDRGVPGLASSVIDGKPQPEQGPTDGHHLDVSRRNQIVAVPPLDAASHDGPIDLIGSYSTGLKILGCGEWNAHKHKASKKRSVIGRKLHIGGGCH